ncbi:DUF1275 family protein [Dactylosporangium sp. NBC_01737]|uniref:DUF1275 family protein n=1 Tax=Dactylosporangium sp. NBC_01737 TaxID=2975959 RepID=UPI002E14C471|nr:DUF1275 family protein [Dactylosporangium sp. NBC_01737]
MTGATAPGTVGGASPGGAVAGAGLSARTVWWLLLALAAAAGCLDAVCVSRLGGVFASVITGNLVQLGRAVATIDGWAAAGAVTAVGGYAAGVAAGTAALRHRTTDPHRPAAGAHPRTAAPHPRTPRRTRRPPRRTPERHAGPADGRATPPERHVGPAGRRATPANRRATPPERHAGPADGRTTPPERHAGPADGRATPPNAAPDPQAAAPHPQTAAADQQAAAPGPQAAGQQQPATGWRRRVTALAAGEAVLLAGVAAGWQAAGARPGHAGTLLLLCAAAAAMGVQSTVTLGSGVAGASTTYLTGTLTGLVRHAVAGPHHVTGTGGAARLGALLCGAAAGTVVLRVAPLWAPALAAALVAAAVAAALVAGARIRPGPRA